MSLRKTFLPRPHAIGQRPEAGLENLHCAEALARATSSGQAPGAHLWMGKHRRRHQLVVGSALAALAEPG